MSVGTGVETKIRDLAEMVCEAVGYRGETVWDTSRPDGQPVRYLDVSKARERIGFAARVPLAEGLRRTVESFRAGVCRRLDRGPGGRVSPARPLIGRGRRERERRTRRRRGRPAARDDPLGCFACEVDPRCSV